MATIVNTPGTNSDSSGSNGLLIGVVLVLVMILLFLFVGVPYFRGSGNGGETPQTNVENNVLAPETPEQAPAQGGETNITIPIPDKVDVNIQNGQDGQ